MPLTRPLAAAVAVLVGAAAAAPATVAAQTPAAQAPPAAAPATQVVAGTVRGTRSTVIVGARVTITPVATAGGAPTGVGRATITDDDGQFRVPGVPAGRITVSVRRIGYQPVTLDTVAAALPSLDVALVPVAQKLSTVVVRERRRGFYTGRMAAFNRRRDLGFGRFITAADIDSRHPIRTTDLLRTIPGVNVVSGFGQSQLRIRNATCPPLIWIDGMPALSGYFDIDAFDPSSLAGIEVYSGAATVPVELRSARGEDACGVIAVWSRVPEPRPKKGTRTFTAADLERLVEAATVYTAEQVDKPARLDSTASLAVNYPDSLRNTHTPGEAMVEFVVDTTGTVELATVGVVAASHPQFADAARRAATEARFIPAERAGRTVRQLVQLPLRWEAGR